jgi:hypothetical protein
MIKNILFSALSLFLVVGTVLGIIFFFRVIDYSFSGAPTAVTVSGEGKVLYKPDLVEISVSVITKGKEAEIVQIENDKKVQVVVDYLKEKGIKEEDIKTRYYSLYPGYEQTEKGADALKIAGYTLNQGLFFKVREIESVGNILGGLTEKGINNIESISFGLSDEKTEELRLQAREQAIEKAKTEFEKIKSQLGFKKVHLVSISDSGYYPYPVPYLERTATGMGGKGLSSVSPIQAGTGEIIVNVSLSYRAK